MSRVLIVVGLVLVGLLAQACASSTARPFACPSRVGAPLALPATNSLAHGTLVATAPTAVLVCELDGDGHSGPRTTVTLRGSAARYLARIVNSSPPVTSRDTHCPQSVDAVLFVASSRRGTRRVSVVSGCRSGPRRVYGQVIITGHAARRVSTGIDLTTYDYPTDRTPRGRATIDITGQPFTRARTLARRSGYRLSGSDQVVDRSLPTGTVIVQSPAPGYVAQPLNDPPDRDDRHEQRLVDAITTVQPAASCSPAQLAGEYDSAGTGTGDIFGSIVLRDVSPRACRLTGRVHITGVDRRGRRVTATVRSRVQPPILLSPRQSRSRRQPPPGPGHWTAQIAITVIYDCQHTKVTPHSWQIQMPTGHITVRNRDPRAANDGLGTLRSLFVCDRHFGAPDVALQH